MIVRALALLVAMASIAAAEPSHLLRGSRSRALDRMERMGRAPADLPLEDVTVVLGLRDYKTGLQELTQRLFRETPAYTLVEETGPDQAKRFVVEIAIAGRARARGVGGSKKSAEQAAAMEALAALAREHPEAAR